MGLGERLARFDDESAVYKAGSGFDKAGVATTVGALLVVMVLMTGAIALVGEAALWMVLGPIAIVFLPVYVMWRRRRNARMTGSPTEWPSSGTTPAE